MSGTVCRGLSAGEIERQYALRKLRPSYEATMVPGWLERLEQLQGPVAPVQAPYPIGPAALADRFRRELEQQEQGGTRRLRGAPRRLRLRQPPLSP